VITTRNQSRAVDLLLMGGFVRKPHHQRTLRASGAELKILARLFTNIGEVVLY
jgi:hypothetical protein